MHMVGSRYGVHPSTKTIVAKPGRARRIVAVAGLRIVSAPICKFGHDSSGYALNTQKSRMNHGPNVDRMRLDRNKEISRSKFSTTPDRCSFHRCILVARLVTSIKNDLSELFHANANRSPPVETDEEFLRKQTTDVDDAPGMLFDCRQRIA